MTRPSKPFLNGLQGLRFVAALMVLVYHVSLELRARPLPARLPFRDLTGIDWKTGVDVFFVVSGFIMYYMAGQSFGVKGAAREFISRRVLRVVPLYWVFTTLFLTIALAAPTVLRNADLTVARTIASYLFVPWPQADGVLMPLLQLGWTLNFEFFFYLLFACGLLLPRRGGLVLIFGTLVALVAVGPWVPKAWFILEFFTRSIVLDFALGIALAILHERGVTLRAPARVALALLSLALFVAFGKSGWHDALFRPVWAGIPSLLLAASAVLGPDFAGKSLPGRLIIVGGGASYSLYLTHMFAVRLFSVVWSKLQLDGGWLFVLAASTGSLLLAVATYYAIEQPLLTLLRRKRTKEQKPFEQVDPSTLVSSPPAG